ncbi:MAG: hypothetical protein KatS3mg129_1472 [Leptospiraceae bacterium]|nr:MAG: hypothetical protein KatS3mg129_1472 [Leptospiraceae bacterium]
MNATDKIKFHTKDLHLVCINLLPLHYDFLKYLAIYRFNGSIPETIFYLLKKYLKYLYKIKIAHNRKTMTAKYQPVTRKYKKYWIAMKPPLWGKMYQLRYYLGYSMSCILRIMLDWNQSFVATIKII